MEGDFSVHRCYEMQLNDDVEVSFNKFMWKQFIPTKVSFMLWATFHNSLPTKDMLQHRGMEVQDSLCVLCKECDESADHIFLHCSYTFGIWSHFMKAFGISWVSPTNLLQCFEAWRLNALTGRSKKIWWNIVYVVPWHIWLERNSRTFGGRAKEEEELILLIKQTLAL
ncbi:uncharacterized protein LOC113305109 [Papaver somniferum]|uniref:uncharacterized protein LOC113305109 n=1 Tax=Papaver somniferum TaxID=3469 RepID=UPI000E7020CA|nr:uncharacterized protein LOC113305109 [Papaver somniferum]